MALKATVFKAAINIADMSRHVYIEKNLTLAQHPSETTQRMMLRLFAWSIFADEHLVFTRGLCEDSEPDLWIKNYSDEIELWIELGLPDEKRLKKACTQAKQVVLFTYDDNSASVWKNQYLNKLHIFPNLIVIHVRDQILDTFASACSRTMSIQATIEEQHVWFTVGECVQSIDVEYWKQL